ncbi:MAG: hypothetical protein H6682_14550 [Candidatus Eisenbacteria bacterium]|nr:hypothetical protein [Candidatus Eisenbacteria bacterium]
MLQTRRLPWYVATSLALLWSAPIAAFAQSSARVEVDMFVPPIQKLEILSPILVMPTLTVAELAPGFVRLPQPIDLSVWSNTEWELSVRLADVKTPDVNELHRLLCSVNGSAPRSLGDDWQVIAKGQKGADLPVSLELRVPFGKRGGPLPGVQELSLDYRLSSAGR